MKEIIERGAGSQIVHVFLPDSSSTTGAGKTGLTNASTGLQINVIRPGESAVTNYTVAASAVETITTIGTYQAPTAGKCRFKEIDATNLPGWYEIQFADALFDTTNNRRSLGGMIFGATNLAPTPFQIQLADPARGVCGPTNLDAAISTRSVLAAGAQMDLINSPNATALAAAADALLDRNAGVETGKTLRQGVRLILAALVGKLSGAATTTVAIRDTNDSKDRVTATVDANGNRTAVTLDAT